VIDLLKMTRLAMAATFLAVAIAPSPAGAQQAAGPTITDKSPTGELTYWNSVKDSTDASNFKAYLENFPNGMFYDVALAKFTSLGGNAADLKPVAKDNSSKANAAMVKQKAVVLQKKVVLSKVWKKPRIHVAKRPVHKHVIHRKRLKLRKVAAPSSDQFGSGRGGGSSGGGGGGGGGWGH
jgi:hypothetical protein